MKCHVCGWPDGPCREKKRHASFFYVYLGKRFTESMLGPCFMRPQFHLLVDDTIVVVSPEREEYLFQLKQENNQTHIFGAGYKKLLEDYNMKRGDRFRIEFNHPPALFAIFPEEPPGVPKHRVLEPYVFEGGASAVVFTHGVQLIAGQTARMNACVLGCGLGSGAVLVHSLSVTDVDHNGLEIVSVLEIPENGDAILIVGEDDNQGEATYYKCSDGRLCLRDGWFDFAVQNVMKSGCDVMILFDKSLDGRLIVSFDVL